MHHDYFDGDHSERYWVDSVKNQDVKCTGFMDVPTTNEDTNTVIEPPNRWSGCSVHDFRTAFKVLKWDETCFVENIPQGNICIIYIANNKIYKLHFLCSFKLGRIAIDKIEKKN